MDGRFAGSVKVSCAHDGSHRSMGLKNQLCKGLVDRFVVLESIFFRLALGIPWLRTPSPPCIQHPPAVYLDARSLSEPVIGLAQETLGGHTSTSQPPLSWPISIRTRSGFGKRRSRASYATSVQKSLPCSHQCPFWIRVSGTASP